MHCLCCAHHKRGTWHVAHYLCVEAGGNSFSSAYIAYRRGATAPPRRIRQGTRTEPETESEVQAVNAPLPEGPHSTQKEEGELERDDTWGLGLLFTFR